MRILDEDNDKKLDRVTLYLTKSEAQELRNDLNQLLDQPHLQHAHVSDESYSREITVCIYDETLLDGFNERSKKLIKEDK